MNTPSRPILRYHGGKWRLAPWIIGHFPPHRTYVEPFGGAASVLLRKSRSYSEVYNDLSDEVVNLFRVLRSNDADHLVDGLRMTPFARTEFGVSYGATTDPVERARMLVVRSHMGFGSGLSINRQITGFRADSKKSGSTPAHDWARFPDCLAVVVERLRGVVIKNRPALDVMAQADSPATLHYVDPPYVHDTRSTKQSSKTLHHRYAHEMEDSDHSELLEFLRGLEGNVVLSGYPCPLYDNALSDWKRVEREALADGARKRVEVLWLNFDPAQTPPPGGMFAIGDAA